MDKFDPREVPLETVIWIGNAVHCPRCGEFDEGEPLKRENFSGRGGYELDWDETHECPDCHQMYKYRNGNS